MKQIYEGFLLHPNNKARIPQNPTTLAAYRLSIKYPPTNVTTPLSTSAPPFTPLSSLNHTTMPTAAAQRSVKTTNPAQPPPTPPPPPPPTPPPPPPTPPPPPPPAVPDKFKILVQCLISHRSEGILRPLRSQIAVELARIGTT